MGVGWKGGAGSGDPARLRGSRPTAGSGLWEPKNHQLVLEFSSEPEIYQVNILKIKTQTQSSLWREKNWPVPRTLPRNRPEGRNQNRLIRRTLPPATAASPSGITARCALACLSTATGRTRSHTSSAATALDPRPAEVPSPRSAEIRHTHRRPAFPTAAEIRTRGLGTRCAAFADNRWIDLEALAALRSTAKPAFAAHVWPGPLVRRRLRARAPTLGRFAAPKGATVHSA